MTLIKAVETKTFIIELHQIKDEYLVIHETIHGVKATDPMDYKLASIVFDNLYDQLEGI